MHNYDYDPREEFNYIESLFLKMENEEEYPPYESEAEVIRLNEQYILDMKKENSIAKKGEKKCIKTI